MVCAELGKNFPEAPSPSRSMEAGAIGGLTMRLARASRQPTSRVHHKPAEIAKGRIAREANRRARMTLVDPSHPLELSQEEASNSTPRMQRTMWAYSQFQKRRGVPILINAMPSRVPAARSIQPRRASL